MARFAGFSIMLALCFHYLFACSVPVFRYALERWNPDLYEVIYFYRDSLTSEDSLYATKIGSRCKRVQSYMFPSAVDSQKIPANMELYLHNVSDTTAGWLKNLWETNSARSLPWIEVKYTQQAGINTPLWEGPPAVFPLTHLVESPIRQEISRRLLDGESAVWVLLHSGNKKKDKAVMKLVNKELKRLENELELPEMTEADLPGWYDAETGPALRVGFSLVHLSGTDPSEQMFIKMLHGTDPGLAETDGPVLFPFFGQGRMLFSFPEKNITEKNIEDACRFLVGWCSCVVKEENPGYDMLMTVDWEEGIRKEFVQDQPLPPLTGFAAILDQIHDSGNTGDNTEQGSVDSKKTRNTPGWGKEEMTQYANAHKENMPAHRDNSEFNTSMDQPDNKPIILRIKDPVTRDEKTGNGNVLYRNLIFLAGGFLVIFIVISLVFIKRKKNAG